MMQIIIFLLITCLVYVFGWLKGRAESFERGYNQGRLDMAVKLNEIKSCDSMIEKILREKYMDTS